VSQEKSEAIVLRRVDFGETSGIVTFLSPERGKLACLAKGLKRKNSAMAGALDTFNRVEAVYFWKDGRGVQNLAEATVLGSYAALKQDLERVTHAAFLLEICLRAANENEASHGMYARLAEALDGYTQVDATPRAWTALQAHGLLCETGHAPELTACADTGAPPEAAHWFSYDHGLAEKIGDRRLSAPMRDVLTEMAEHDAPPPADASDEAFWLLAGFAARQLETDFRSIRVIRQMFD
jgi:DNA repair protein RecO (recombination protein O)